MRKIFIFSAFCIFVITLHAQDFEKIYRSMSFKDKMWCIQNYDCVLAAVDISNDFMQTMDSLNKVKFLGGNSEGGKFDALRHIFWMYSLSNEIGEECSRRIGQIYENYGYYIYLTTENSGYDSVGMQMDLFNNELGILLSRKEIEKPLIIKTIEEIINSGQAKVIKKSQSGESLDVKYEVIPESEWKKQWNNRRVLVDSDFEKL